MDIFTIALIMGAFLVVAILAFYAGKLLFQLRQQTQRQNNARLKRVNTLKESIYTIALAVEQQQCNLSEGAIRLVNLLDCMPVKRPPNCQRDYPALFELYSHVRDLPTHDERKQLPAQVIAKQDAIREEHEANLAQKISHEVAAIRQLTFD